MHYIKYVLLAWVIFQSSFLKAQQYPIDIQVFVTPPYQQSLRDYWASFEPKMQVHLLLKDLNSPMRNVALRFSLENVQGQPLAQTASYAFPFQTQLSSGVRKTLSNIELKPLFAFENLQGVSEHFYNDLLPEGAYFMCFTAYDVATQTPLSAKARTLIQIRRYTPPLPTLPAKGEIISKKNQFQHLVFQWMLRDPAPFTQYEFTLKEVWDNNLSPDEAFISGRLVYQGKVPSNTILYGPDKPILLENKRYVWKVRAFTQNPNNPNQRQSFFHNNGESEAFYFDYVSHCEAPKFLTAITKDNTANIRWITEPVRANTHSGENGGFYKILYREKGKNWKSQMSNHPQATLIGLKRGRNYVYKVGVACGLGQQTQGIFGEQTYLYSTEQEFVTPHKQNDSTSVQCGVKPEIRIRNREPLQEVLGVNETFVAGDFPVTVLRATGSNGVFSGEGYVQVPYLLDTKIKVKFDGIKINSERQLFEGKLVTTYDKTEKNVQFIQEGIGEVFGDAGVKTNKIDFEIAEIKKDENGRITVIGKPDEKTGIAPQITLPVGSDYQLSDASGKTWTLDEQGEVTSVGEKADTKLAQNQGKNNLPKGQPKPENFEIQWDFSQSEFAFDASGEIPYKALVKSKNDVFQVVIKQKDTLRYSFHFQTDKGLKVDSKKEKEGVFEISRKGLFDFGDEELWVVAKNAKTEKEEVIGKCMLVHLSEKEVNVTLIPTAENLQIDIDAIQRIYAKVGVKLHISIDKIFSITEKIDTKNAFGDLSTYSPEQQGIITLYKSQRTIKSDTYYVFVGKQQGSQVGYMRLGGQFGFALDGNSRTIAHELGHGIFRLEHPFKKDVTKKGTFRTLMDYAQETTFAYSDWKQINDPALKIGFFGGQSEGALQQDEDILLRIAQAMQGLGGKAFLKCKECESESKKIEQNLEGEIITIDINTKKYYKCILGEHKNGAISFGIKGLNKNLSTQYDKTTLTEYYEKFSSVIKANTQQDFLLVGDNQSVTKCDVPLQFSDSFCGYTQGSQINKEDKTYIAGELENCFENNLIALEKQLVIVKSQLRKDQNVEWEHGGKVYRLNADNQIEEVQNVLSDQDIIAGNWTGEQEQKLRFYRDEKGTIQLKAFGYRKDLRIVKDKTADLEAVSKHILQQTNVYFKNLKDITQKAPQINDESFADGRKIAIDKDATYIRIFSEGVGITKTLLKTGEVESNVYLDKPKEKAFIKVPGTATGSVEAGVMAVTDITGTVVIIYDLATDETARKETYEGLVKIKDEIKENPSELFLILADVILEEATGLSADDWQKTQAQQTDKGEKSHLYSKGAVRSTITAVASGKLIAKLPKMADDLVVKMKKAKVKKLIPSLKRFDVAGEFAKGKKLVEQTIKWGENQITLKWKRVGNKIDFGNRSDLATILGTTDNIEAHHILPWKICENEEIVRLAALDGFHPNMIENGLGLEKYTKLVGNGMHGNHPAYNTFVKNKLRNQMLEKPNITPEQANKFLQEELIPELKTHIIKAQNSDMNLNEYFKQLN